MDNFISWWKKDRKYITLAKSLLLAMLPLACCFVYLAGQGHQLNEVYLPSSPSSIWNDELIYYKQVESVINYGYPQGYFGYNESHARLLSFGAWSPILLLPWVMWGLLFGWGLLSPVLCNIALLCLSCFLFVWLVKPGWKQIGALTILFSLYTPCVRYILSGMPEAICFSILIVFYSLAFNHLQAPKKSKLAVLFLLAAFMTLMRPYLILFMLLPLWIWIRAGQSRARRWRRLAASAAILGVSLGLYACISHYLTAPFFSPLFSTDWISVFFESGIISGFHNIYLQLYYGGLPKCLEYLSLGFRTGLPAGTSLAGYLVCMAVLLIQSFLDWRKVRHLSGESTGSKGDPDGLFSSRSLLPLEAHLAFSCAAMFITLLLMYPLEQGSRHLLTFMAAAIFIISLMRTGFYRNVIVVGVFFAYIYSYIELPSDDYQVPFIQEDRRAAMAEWAEIFDRELILQEDEVPDYENTVIWVVADMVADVSTGAQWQLLYALPQGFGISCCMPTYILEHIDTLQCGYLFAPRGGDIEEACLQSGYIKLAEDSHSVLFKLNGHGF